MSCFVLKCIALVTMIIDHVGLVFFPTTWWIREIGRLSFPIYAFLLAQGLIHTRSKPKYALRLLAFGIISEVPHDLACKGKFLEWTSQNIMFELLAGLIVLWCIDVIISKESRWWQRVICIIPIVPVTFLSAYLSLSYGVYGIALMVGYYIFSKWNPFKKCSPLAALSGSGITYAFNGVRVWRFTAFGKLLKILSINTIQMYAIYSGIPILFYNGKPGKYKLKWFFYTIYPVHLLILYFIAKAMGIR